MIATASCRFRWIAALSFASLAEPDAGGERAKGAEERGKGRMKGRGEEERRGGVGYEDGCLFLKRAPTHRGGGGDNNVAAPSTAEVKHYLDELQSANTSRATGSGVPSYLDSVASSTGPSLSVGAGSGPTSYLQSIGSSQQNAPNVAIDTTSKTETKQNEDGSFTIERQVTVVIGDGESNHEREF